MAITATTAAIAATVASTAAAAYSTDVNYKNAKAQQKMATYNANVARSQIRSANIEKSVAMDNTRADAMRKIATGRAAMVASGNVGPTADTSILASYLDLDKDISALEYNYGSRVASAENAINLYTNEGRMAGANAVNALVGGGLNTLTAFSKGMYGVSMAEGWGYPNDGLTKVDSKTLLNK